MPPQRPPAVERRFRCRTLETARVVMARANGAPDGHGASKREWGPALLPTPTVRGEETGRSLHPALERVPAEAFQPRSVPFRVPRPAREAPSNVPRVARQSELRPVPFESLREQAPSVSRDDLPKRTPAAFPFSDRRREASSLPLLRSVRGDEANFVPRSFRGFPAARRLRSPLDRFGKVGSAPAFARASRFFPSAPGLSGFIRHPRRSAAFPPFRPLLPIRFPVSGKASLPPPLNNARPIRFAPAPQACG